MADITMCQIKDCPKADTCYRINAPANKHRQSYADFKPICNKENNYQYYYVRSYSNEQEESVDESNKLK